MSRIINAGFETSADGWANLASNGPTLLPPDPSSCRRSWRKPMKRWSLSCPDPACPSGMTAIAVEPPRAWCGAHGEMIAREVTDDMPEDPGITSLYRCPGSCGEVRRGEPLHAYVCMCDALPNGPGYDHPFEAHLVDREKYPYFSDREHPMVEFADDGRDLPDDLDFRKGVWIG